MKKLTTGLTAIALVLATSVFATKPTTTAAAIATISATNNPFSETKVVAMADLPKNISAAILKEYDGYTIGKDITQISFEGVTSYYFTAENDKQTLTVKIDGNTNFQVQGRVKK